MPLILTIPAQPATQMMERQAALFACYKDGTLLLDCTDYKKPARFLLTQADNFPWDQFIEKMIYMWQLGDYRNLPQQFRPQKRIPQFVLDNPALADVTIDPVGVDLTRQAITCTLGFKF